MQNRNPAADARFKEIVDVMRPCQFQQFTPALRHQLFICRDNVFSRRQTAARVLIRRIHAADCLYRHADFAVRLNLLKRGGHERAEGSFPEMPH